MLVIPYMIDSYIGCVQNFMDGIEPQKHLKFVLRHYSGMQGSH